MPPLPYLPQHLALLLSGMLASSSSTNMLEMKAALFLYQLVVLHHHQLIMLCCLEGVYQNRLCALSMQGLTSDEMRHFMTAQGLG